MSYKIVKNSAGDVVGFGPNVEQYEPTIPTGGTLTISDTLPQPSLLEAKAKRIAYINAEADKAFAQILAPYPAHEVSTWPNQYAEAWALQSDPAAYTPTLAGIALVSGETVAVLAAAVLTKAAAYTSVSGQIVGKRKLKTAQIEACLTNAEVEAITW